MDTVSGIVVYVLLWWWIFFMALPFGVRRADHVASGHEPSAPVNPRLGIKAIAATAISAVLWLGIWLIIDAELISIRAFVSTWE